MPGKKKSPITDIDDLPSAEIDKRLAETRAHLDAIRALWPGLVRLDEGQRQHSLGKGLNVLSPALRLLFGVLLPQKGPPPALAAHFDALGDQDSGKDPAHFEVDLLSRRLARVEAEQKLHDELSELCRHFGDDILSTGGEVIGPGLLALDLARSLSRANPGYQAHLAPVLDALRQMTKRARRALEKKGDGATPIEVSPK
ncbi:MAG: hypothetical protein U0359_12050 [Byssovorax sp.]